MTNSWAREYSRWLQLSCPISSYLARRNPRYILLSVPPIFSRTWITLVSRLKENPFSMEELTGADTRGDGLYAKRLISSCNEESLEHKKLVVASETTEYVPGYFDQNKMWWRGARPFDRLWKVVSRVERSKESITSKQLHALTKR